MTREYSRQPIPPFPPHINRDIFGAWLSGFTDGEGTFMLSYRVQKEYPLTRTMFQLGVRADDFPVIRLIQSYLACGHITFRHRGNKGSKPGVLFWVTQTHDLVRSVIPHFDKYPLFAKKSADYAIWKMAVLFAHRLKVQRLRPANGACRGFRPRWTPDDIAVFRQYVRDIHEVREYKHPVATDNEPHLRNVMARVFEHLF